MNNIIQATNSKRKCKTEQFSCLNSGLFSNLKYSNIRLVSTPVYKRHVFFILLVLKYCSNSVRLYPRVQ